jgi:endonuclease YncB( thermonuclease family)
MSDNADYEAMFKVFDLNDTRLWHYRAFIARVIDGDTVVAIIDKGFTNLKMERLRLAGVDAPELRPRKGTDEERIEEKARAKVATERVRELIEGKEVVIQTKKTGKFGRWLADIYLPGEPGRTVNQLLLEEGLATEYPR